MNKGFFITGTDTDIGKTTIALGLMHALQKQGYTVAAFKPVSAGCIQTADGLRNEDAIRLMQQASIDLPYAMVNPYAFEPHAAPHIAAHEANIQIDIKTLKKAYLRIARAVDIVIIEGAGGWMVPINNHQTMADLALELGQAVINIVGIRLGCLNHALLTTQAIKTSGLPFVGWIANHLSNNIDRAEENIKTLTQAIAAPCLGNIPYQKAPDTALISSLLNTQTLIAANKTLPTNSNP